MKTRVAPRSLSGLLLALLALTSITVLAPAQTRTGGAPPPGARPAPRAPARPAPPKPRVTRDGGIDPRGPEKEPMRETLDGGVRAADRAPEKSEGVAEARTVDGGAKVYRFGELEIETRLKSPQIVYFLRRVRAEFAADDLGHRSFNRELSDTRNAPAF